ncbi:YeeE/YedE family protein [Psychrobacter sp. JCM 18901]|uniref:YeeE/YedE family protein n=1 Tax=Psychrobacter sp. JCM 18901 TaxID=1298609 RepID=UPI0004B36043|nr:YeeE/YedE family protein [Psychrobacter sp. JCM 18901]
MTTLVQPVNDTKDPIVRDDLALNAPQKPLIMGGGIVGLIVLAYLLATQHISQSLLLGIGLLLGYTLFHARFGFTSAFRRMMSVGNGQAMRSHMLMLAVAVTLFAPILAYGTTLFGGPVAGYVAPLGVSLVVGAFVFGIGMQLGGGCASGTLYAVGGGRSVMFITFIFFIVGATIGLITCHSGQKRCPLMRLSLWQPLQVLAIQGHGWYRLLYLALSHG